MEGNGFVLFVLIGVGVWGLKGEMIQIMINWGYTELFLALEWSEGGMGGEGPPGRRSNPFCLCLLPQSSGSATHARVCPPCPPSLPHPTHARKGFAILETAIPKSPNLHVHKEKVPLKWGGGMKALIVAYKTRLL